MLIFFSGCAVKVERPLERPPEKPVAIPEEKALPKKTKTPLSLIQAESAPSFNDDLDIDSLVIAVERSIQYYNGRAGNNSYQMGSEQISGKRLRESLLLFMEIMAGTEPSEVKQRRLIEEFDIYKATGIDNKGFLLFTGYFEPIMDGSRERTERFRYPIYKTPDETVVVNLGKFNSKYGNDRIVGRLKGKEVIPHFSRAEIDGNPSPLAGRNLELLWVDDPITLFFLHIQGSGKIRLPDGNFVQISYEQYNGHPYRSIARYLLDKGKLTPAEVTHQNLKKYLRNNPDELSDILNFNESYVFFRFVEKGPIGALGLTLTSGRSIATDLDLFPKGALAFIRLRKPLFDENGNIKKWESFSRFVLNQDTGGVIKGPGRVDLFCGTGDDAELIAGSLKERGELYFLVKKSSGLPLSD